MKDSLSDLKQIVVDAAEEKKAFDILILDIRNRSDLTDYFFLCSGNSKMQVKAIVDSIIEKALQSKYKPYAVEGLTQGDWVIIDLGDIMVHVFQKSVRQHYDLERLWEDVPVVEAVN